MRKMIFLAAVTLAVSTGAIAQTIAAKAGYTSGIAKVNNGFFDRSSSEGGFHIGLVAGFELTEAISLQPEVLFTSISSSSFLQIPVMGKYEMGDSGFSAQLGPQINFVLEETGEDFSALSVGLAIGAGYDITDKIFVEAHYAFQLTNSFTGENDSFGEGDDFIESGDLSLKTNFLNIGLGYRFL